MIELENEFYAKRANVFKYSEPNNIHLSNVFPRARPEPGAFSVLPNVSTGTCEIPRKYTCGISLSHGNLLNRLGEGDSQFSLKKCIKQKRVLRKALTGSLLTVQEND